MLPFYRKYWRTALDIGLIALTVFLIMFSFSYLYKIAAPIFLAFVIFWMIEPFARFLNRRKIKKSIATGISMLLFIVVILGVIVGAVTVFILQINVFLIKLPDYSAILQVQIIEKSDYLLDRFNALPDDIAAEIIEKAKEYGGVIVAKGTTFTSWVLGHLISMLSSVSTFVINFVIAIILAYFLSIEIDTWKRVAKEKTPNTFKKAFAFLRENVLRGLASYIKSQLKLITLTFVIIFIALLALGVDNAFSVSLLAAFFDLVPLLGVSAVFVPWIIYLLIVGQTTLAFWLIGVFLVVVLVRQILEPKITGDSLGVSGFTMLSFMIISLSLFGVAGLILSPILIILIKALYDQGYIKQWIRLPADEYEPMNSTAEEHESLVSTTDQTESVEVRDSSEDNR
jgi:sporulation integral membrane protein YtvI